MGFNPNFQTGSEGSPYYDYNTGVFVFEGFTSTGESAAYSESNWPYKKRDKRNWQRRLVKICEIKNFNYFQ